jgi:asparagine synthase (glutamine-hydrolysing)
MLWDTIGYLPGDILTKLDRASMAVSLEARVPLLDHRVVEFAWRLPINLKVRRGRTKWILREVLDRYVPREIVDRPKAGFGIPVGEWLRGPLREWADDLLSADRLASEGYLRPDPIHVRWHEHLSREGQWDRQLWNALMFQAWLEAQ